MHMHTCLGSVVYLTNRGQKTTFPSSPAEDAVSLTITAPTPHRYSSSVNKRGKKKKKKLLSTAHRGECKTTKFTQSIIALGKI